MNEKQWLACNDPQKMLRLLRGVGVGRRFFRSLPERPSDRKLRLFAAACFRHRWYPVADERCRKAVELAEPLADGTVGPGACKRYFEGARQAADDARYAAFPPRFDLHPDYATPPADDALTLSPDDHTHLEAVWFAAKFAAACLKPDARRAARYAAARGDAREATLLRCIFGNPFRPIQVHAAWLRWHDGAIVHMAQTIYDERRFQDLPILADALEEAGCTDPEILGHCRGLGEHARGCYVLDLILGRT